MNQESKPFDFTPEDLDANRRGIISEHQRQQLIGMGRGMSKFTDQSVRWLFLFVVVAGGLILAMQFSSAGSSSALLSDPFSLAILFGSVCVVVPLVIALVYFFNKRTDAAVFNSANGPLLSDEGIAKITNGYGKYGTQYKIVRIGKKEYIALRPYASLFKAGQNYRIYYVKAGALPEMILSIDELEK